MDSRTVRDSSDAPPLRMRPVLPVAPLMSVWFACVATYVYTSLMPGRSTSVEILRQAAYLIPFAAAFIASSLAFARGRAEERRLWRSLTVGTSLILVSESYVSVRVVLGLDPVGGWPTMPVVLSFVAGVAFVVMLFRLTDFRTLSSTVIVRHATDALGASMLVFGLVLAGVLMPLAALHSKLEPVELLVAAGYSVVGLMMLLAVIVNFASRAWGRWELWERQVVSALGLYGIATALWPLWYLGAVLDPRSTGETIVEVLWLSGMSLAFAGAFTRLRSPLREPRFRSVPRMRPMRHNAVSVTAPVLYTFGILLFAYLGHTRSDPSLISGAYLVIAVGLAIVVAARQGSSAVENEALFRSSVNDPLTDLYGHRYFHERLQLDLDLAARHGDEVSIVVLDLDEFSRINNVWGHARGDEVLRQAACAVRSACRAIDAVCRIGGDEFAMILSGTGCDEAQVVCERAREALTAVRCPDGRPLTASLGVAVYPTDGSDRNELVRRADGAVYWAKYHGKNRIVVFDESVVEALSAEERLAKLEKETHLSTVRALAAAVDARDPLTQFHSRNVAILSVMLGQELELDEDKMRLLEVAALLHDIGKIGISDRVLRKKGPLTPAELRHVREHPALGEKILSSTHLDEILPWVRHHHERYDGSGYPDGMVAEHIPFESRLLSICDAYDAMTSGRPYRSALSSTAAIQELDLCIGTQFDPALTEAFIRMVGRRRLLRPETRFQRDAQGAAEAG
ncbi:MAG: diguanylate cyclase [Coriobacteriia bacterium]